MKVADAIGAQLDWMVAKCEGKNPSMFIYKQTGALAKEHNYSTGWAQGGPIIEREGMVVQPFGSGQWLVAKADEDNFMRRHYSYRGPTLLIAAMRCYVASKLGDEVEIPEELAYAKTSAA